MINSWLKFSLSLCRLLDPQTPKPGATFYDTKFGNYDIKHCNSEKREYAVGAELELYNDKDAVDDTYDKRGITNIKLYCEHTSTFGVEGNIDESINDRFVIPISN